MMATNVKNKTYRAIFMGIEFDSIPEFLTVKRVLVNVSTLGHCRRIHSNSRRSTPRTSQGLMPSSLTMNPS